MIIDHVSDSIAVNLSKIEYYHHISYDGQVEIHYRYGKQHNDNGPAYINKTTGTKMWKLHGKLHRTAGPAIERNDRTYEWYYDNELHCESGPAIKKLRGSSTAVPYEAYMLDGEFIGFTDNDAATYYSGPYITPEQFQKIAIKHRMFKVLNR